jgi:thiol-disulfide isomerase/thioredoxin
MKRYLFAGLITLLAAACSSEPIIETLPPPAVIVEEPIITATPAEVAAQPATITPTATEAPYVSSLPNLGTAPELENEVWLNTESPLRLADLRGQVVLLDMWTFDCINCINTLPSLREWHGNYGAQGLVIIGNHYPEFDYERDLNNLRAAIDRLDVRWPIAQDNDRQTWSAYHNRYWPTMYLIDKWGNIRYTHIGEGRYAETDAAIRDLLAEEYPG